MTQIEKDRIDSLLRGIKETEYTSPLMGVAFRMLAEAVQILADNHYSSSGGSPTITGGAGGARQKGKVGT